ncbi:mpv17-like protein 2 [Tetranychus urticae]|uniref:Mpv17-like protein 2 n=1 Tax=Tetranychus urticae TaxID=32264 RepID=T1KFW0_TETUR|nr:mpv17-like protein 2 [Tetranychus urticae]
MYVHHQLRKIFNLAFSPRYLLTTNTVVGTLGLVGADVIQQYASHYVYPKPVEKTKEMEPQAFVFDNKRAFGMAAGGLIFGAAGHYWYLFLDRKFPGRSLTVISKKLLCEALIAPPLLTVFYYLVARTEGKSNEEWFEGFKKNIVDIMLVDWCCFAPAQALNFYFLPPKYRYLFVAVLTFFYDNFLSFVFHR